MKEQNLYCFIILLHERRQVLHFKVAQHPTAARTALQMIEAFPEDTGPRFPLRDRDSIYGNDFRSVDRNSPIPRSVESGKKGQVISIPEVGGHHHRYQRAA